MVVVVSTSRNNIVFKTWQHCAFCQTFFRLSFALNIDPFSSTHLYDHRVRLLGLASSFECTHTCRRRRRHICIVPFLRVRTLFYKSASLLKTAYLLVFGFIQIITIYIYICRLFNSLSISPCPFCYYNIIYKIIPHPRYPTPITTIACVLRTVARRMLCMILRVSTAPHVLRTLLALARASACTSETVSPVAPPS